MAAPLLETHIEGQSETYPLLMERQTRHAHEHIIDIARNEVGSMSSSRGNGHSDLQAHAYESSSSFPTASNSGNSSPTSRGDDYRHQRRSPLNSGLWISFELIVNVSQITAAVIVLSLSRHEHPQTPLFVWVIGYTSGCFVSLPFLYWRYKHRNSQGSAQDRTWPSWSSFHNTSPGDSLPSATSFSETLEGEHRSSAAISRFRPRLRVQASSLETLHPSIEKVTVVSCERHRIVILLVFIFNGRINALVDCSKIALDCFFAIWFVVGNVWIFGGHSTMEVPTLYWLCVVFLLFSCIGYAIPFVLCATICCCLPCIFYILGFRESMGQIRGATPESINALPTYKFRSVKSQNREENGIIIESLVEGVILSAGTDKERIISAEDAVCCICLSKYWDNDELCELPCTHFFHRSCVDKWLKINAVCPLCKFKIGVAAGPSTAASSSLHSDRRVGNSEYAIRIPV